jgi:hypothetical protein
VTCYDRVVRALLALLVLPLAGCPTGSECTTDFDCGGGLVCANTHDCLSPELVRRVAIRWTVRDNPADEITCAPIPNLDLAVFDSETDDQASYAPVPCAPGQFVFDKLPTQFDRVMLRVVNGSETLMADIPSGAGSADVLLNFTSGDLPAPDAAPVPDAAQVPDAGVIDAL